MGNLYQMQIAYNHAPNIYIKINTKHNGISGSHTLLS